MAKIMLGSNIGAASGAIGNQVISHNRGGYYIRQRVIPTKVTSSYTVNVRDIMTICSRAWGALTAAQQAAWNTWAQANPVTDRLGQKQVLFGNAAYCQLNSRILQAGDTAIDVPPTGAAPSPLLTLSALAKASDQSCVLTFTATPLAAGLHLFCQAALLVNPGQNYFANLLKLVKISSAAQATGLDIGAEMVLRFGTMATGHRVKLLCSVFDGATGLMSGPMLAETTVVAGP